MGFNKIKLKKLVLRAGFSISIIGSLFIGSLLPFHTTISKAEKKEEADIRFIFTTDIHGQLNSMDYEQGVDYNNGGLARAYDLIMRARNEKPDENSFTFDVGDVMYDYTTEYIFSKDQKEIQPIYKALSLVGYDAITLGNHEFDYGYEYMTNQLKWSGLMDITVVSNVIDSKTGEYPFRENMVITREIETKDGDTTVVKIGIIGETIPNLTAKTHSYTGILKTEDIVENVKKQSKKLKEQGADVIVVLAHSGIGPVNPEVNFKNVSYALTKIDEVDVVLCGHEHNTFPADTKTSSYYLLPGVDKKTHLVNGKNLVMANDRGKSIGVVDLTLDVSDGDVEIIERKSNVRFVSDYDTVENKEMSSLFGYWEDEFLKYSKDKLGEVEKGYSIENFFGLFRDNSAVQLLNDAKRSHALRMIHTQIPEYKDYPVIAVSTYNSFGFNSYLDYINIKDEITESDLVTMQPYNSYLHLYTITGAQLREWLEWSASAYEVTTGTLKWNDSTMTSLMKETNLRSLIKEDWLLDWNNFYVFDGIEYTINPLFEPRYNIAGSKINNSYRVQNITYNGKPVTEDTKFILAADKITKPSIANSGVEKQSVFSKFHRGQAVLGEYIKTKGKSGTIMPAIDYNWKLSFGKGYKFIVKAPTYSKEEAKQSDSFFDFIRTVNNYDYYIATYPEALIDSLAPSLLVIPEKTSPTGTGYMVIVNATDSSGIKTIKYKKGDVNVEDTDWNLTKVMEGPTFKVDTNGIYSVFAEDNNGNKVVEKIVIDNISDQVMGVPKLESYSNRKTQFKGTAEPGAIIIIEAYTGSYDTVADINGKFSYPLPAQPSDSDITVYAMNKESGIVSERASLIVKRTGPNQPGVNNVYNNSNQINGFINDDDAKVVAVMGNNVYVPSDGGMELYKNATEIYDSAKKIIETKYATSYNRFSLEIDPMEIGTEIKLYNIDHVNRVSRVKATTVLDGGPNLPVVYDITNIERQIIGNVTSSNRNTIFDVYAQVNDNIYQGKTDKEGNFIIEIPEQLYVGQNIYIYATDYVKGVTRKSARTKVQVSDVNDHIDSMNSLIEFIEVSNKDTEIYGRYYYKNETIFLAVLGKNGERITNDLYETKSSDFGSFSYSLPKTLPIGTKIYAMTRYIDGDIISVATTEVIPTIPTKPYITELVNNSTKNVYVVTDEQCEVTVKIGSKEYKSKKYVYDENQDAYIYTVATGRADSGSKVNIYAENIIGKSKVFTTDIIKKAPDSPKVKDIYTDSTTITGKIELFDVVPTGENTKTDTIDDNLNSNTDDNLESTQMLNEESEANILTFVEQTETKIFAKIGKKVYTGSIDEEGNFSIKIKKQKEGTVVSVWGMNKGGRGPITSVIVKSNQE